MMVGKFSMPAPPMLGKLDIRDSKQNVSDKLINKDNFSKKREQSYKSTGIDDFSISSILNYFDSSTNYTSSSDFNDGGGDFGGGGASDSY